MSGKKPLKISPVDREGQSTLTRVIAIAIQLICAGILVPIVSLCRYVHPSGIDDYLNAEWSSAVAYFRHLYNVSSGRYFSLSLGMLTPLHWHSITGYRLACCIILVLFICVFFRLIRRSLTAYSLAPLKIANTIAAVSIVLILMNMKGLAETFFWYTSAVVHTVAAILMAVFLYSLILLKEQTNGVHRMYLCGLCIAIMGSSELMMFLCIALCLAGLTYAKLQGLQSKTNTYRLVLLICFIAGLIYLAAPGNYARLDNQHRSLAMVFPNWLYYTQKFIYTWILDPFLLSYSLLLIAITQRYPLRKPYMSLLASFLLPIGIAYLLALPINLFLGTLYYPRVVNTVYIFFVLGWGVFLLHLSLAIKNYLSNSVSSRSLLRQALFVAGIIIVLISLNTHDLRKNNLFLAYKGLIRGIPQRYNEELEARYLLLRQKGDTVTVAPLRTKYGNAVYFLDITPDAQNEQNLAYAHYWGKKAVARAKDSANNTISH
jgi:hypothetical protein